MELVRKNLDELDPNGSIMFDSENGSDDPFNDNNSLNTTIKKSLPEAINAVHLAAPAVLLEGEDVKEDVAGSMSDDSPYVFSFLVRGYNILRPVAFQMDDSDIVVRDVIPYGSPEARKQANKYICGRPDRPRLVIGPKDTDTSWPSFQYYSCEIKTAEVKFFNIIERQDYSDSKTSYDCSPRLKQNVIDYLTGLVLDIYGDQRAQSFYTRANNFSSI